MISLSSPLTTGCASPVGVHLRKKQQGAKWSFEIFKIREIKEGHSVRYYLQDYDGERVDGAFYGAELQSMVPESLILLVKCALQLLHLRVPHS